MSDLYKSKRQASFKGLPFFMEKVGFSGGGRKFVTHEFPNGRGHLNEDLAPNVGKFSVSGYLIGFDAIDRAKAFKSVCGQSGAGQLVLPDEPSNYVRCNGFSYDVVKEELNRVSISFEFTEEAGGFGGLNFFAGLFLEIGLKAVGGAVGRMFGGGLHG